MKPPTPGLFERDWERDEDDMLSLYKPLDMEYGVVFDTKTIGPHAGCVAEIRFGSGYWPPAGIKYEK